MAQAPNDLSDIKVFDELLFAYTVKLPAWWRNRPGWAMSALFLIALSPGILHLPLPGNLPSYAFWSCLLSGCISALIGQHKGNYYRKREKAELCRLLAYTQDTRLITRLIALASGMPKEYGLSSDGPWSAWDTLSREATIALTRLLPKIRPEDAQMLASYHRQWLYERLQGADAPLITAILQATMRCGSIEALSYIEPLAKGKGIAKHDTTIRQLAQECAQRLQERLHRLKAPQTLLRGSTAPPDSMLEPGIAAASEELLRPGLVPDDRELVRVGKAPTDLLLPVVPPSDIAPHQLLHPAAQSTSPPLQLLRPAQEGARPGEETL